MKKKGRSQTHSSPRKPQKPLWEPSWTPPGPPLAEKKNQGGPLLGLSWPNLEPKKAFGTPRRAPRRRNSARQKSLILHYDLVNLATQRERRTASEAHYTRQRRLRAALEAPGAPSSFVERHNTRTKNPTEGLKNVLEPRQCQKRARGDQLTLPCWALGRGLGEG